MLSPASQRVEVAGEREHRLACDEVGDEEERHLEGVPAEDVGDGELVVADPDGCEPRADLGKRRGEGEHGGAEDDAVDPGPVGERVPGHLEDDAGGEREERGEREDRDRLAGRSRRLRLSGRVPALPAGAAGLCAGGADLPSVLTADTSQRVDPRRAR